jgi:hypothetical protein
MTDMVVTGMTIMDSRTGAAIGINVTGVTTASAMFTGLSIGAPTRMRNLSTFRHPCTTNLGYRQASACFFRLTFGDRNRADLKFKISYRQLALDLLSYDPVLHSLRMPKKGANSLSSSPPFLAFGMIGSTDIKTSNKFKRNGFNQRAHSHQCVERHGGNVDTEAICCWNEGYFATSNSRIAFQFAFTSLVIKLFDPPRTVYEKKIYGYQYNEPTKIIGGTHKKIRD